MLQLESDLGLGPWDVLNQGLSERTPLSFGAANIVVALVVLVLAWSLGARIGPGTVANAVLIGVFVDLMLRLDFVERLSSQPLAARVALLVGGILLVGLGSGLYIGAALGAGPRDSLMLVGARRTGARLGIVRDRAGDRRRGGRLRARRHARDRDTRVRARRRPGRRARLRGARAPRVSRPRQAPTRVRSALDEGRGLRRRSRDAAPGADPRDEQAPASGRQLADDLLPAPAARARAASRASSSSPGKEHAGQTIDLLGDGRLTQRGSDEPLLSLDLTYKVQTQPGGIAQVVGMARDFAQGEKLVVVLGDNIFERSQADAIRSWASGSDGALIFVKEVPDPENFGVVVVRTTTGA